MESAVLNLDYGTRLQINKLEDESFVIHVENDFDVIRATAKADDLIALHMALGRLLGASP